LELTSSTRQRRAFDSSGHKIQLTGNSYAGGKSEIVMGKVIKNAGWKRNDIVISTKVTAGLNTPFCIALMIGARSIGVAPSEKSKSTTTVSHESTLSKVPRPASNDCNSNTSTSSTRTAPTV
jgi:aryl-alcohol dehydrogenase-like predicted oxidoreductase